MPEGEEARREAGADMSNSQSSSGSVPTDSAGEASSHDLQHHDRTYQITMLFRCVSGTHSARTIEVSVQ
jgi:hypothetical protein